MSQPTYQVRRATVDDFPSLRALWDSMKLPVAELEHRLPEFQVAQDAQGGIVCAIGFEMIKKDARIHSEAFLDFSRADEVRALFWTRFRALTVNHGVARLWTQEGAPFWSHNGFQPPSDELAKKLPEPWRQLPGRWSVLKLKDEEATVSVDREFDMFMEAERARTARALEKARRLKATITVIALVAGFAMIGVAIYLFLTRPGVAGSPGP